MKKVVSTVITATIAAAVFKHYPQIEEKVVKAAQPVCAKILGCFTKKRDEAAVEE